MEDNPYYSQAPQQQPYINTHDAAPVMTTGQWIITMLLLCIPFMNIIRSSFGLPAAQRIPTVQTMPKPRSSLWGSALLWVS